MIAWRKCLTISRGKTHEKFFAGPSLGQTGQTWAQN